MFDFCYKIQNLFTHTHTHTHTHARTLGQFPILSKSNLKRPFPLSHPACAEVRVCFAYFLSHVLTGCQSHSYFMKLGEWYDRSALFHHFSVLERDGFLFSFLFINDEQSWDQFFFFFSFSILRISHITWHAQLYNKDSPGPSHPAGTLPEQSWLINREGKLSVFSVE